MSHEGRNAAAATKAHQLENGAKSQRIWLGNGCGIMWNYLGNQQLTQDTRWKSRTYTRATLEINNLHLFDPIRWVISGAIWCDLVRPTWSEWDRIWKGLTGWTGFCFFGCIHLYPAGFSVQIQAGFDQPRPPWL
jgi:hypothetical protein